ncbi:MAG: translation initiation factor IF-2 [Verrucomicrobia bacterium]|nr:translation initiation factor IF-2 [Verrucomicrobiota bacterium]
MSIRVHELAKRCGLSNKEMMEKLVAIKYPVKSVSSTVDNITAESLEQEYGYVPPPPAPPEPPAPAPPPVSEPQPPPPQEPPPAPVVVPEPPQPVAPPPPPVPPPAPKPPPPMIGPVKPATAVAPPKPPVAAPRQAVVSTVKPPPPPRIVAPPPSVSVGPTFTTNERGQKVIQMKPPVVVRDLAQRVGVKAHLLLAELMQLNVFANLNETIGEDVARKICERHGFLFDLEKRDRGAGLAHPPQKREVKVEAGEKAEDLKFRQPVVTVMGHVDHGKTSLLDAIRKTDVVAHESGGITQHIGASVVTLPDGKKITFLDTPGHQAFTKMRARGANVTDIAILVVAADDGVMPQTLEAINHAKAAKVPVIIAVNKCDLAAANPDRVKKQLQEHGLNPESWGGDTIAVDVSATTKKNLDTLLEMILLQAEMMELKANPKGPAKGNVIEAQMEPGMGPTATVLVRKGTLKTGDALICGAHMAKVRALIDDKGKRVKEAGPATPVKIVGFTGLPEAGAEFEVLKNEKEARELSEQRALAERAAAATAEAAGGRRGTRLEDLLSQLEKGEKKKLGIVLKADVQGSLEAIHDSLGKLKSDKVELDVIHGAVGTVTENDVLLASASDAVIIGFRVKTESGVTDVAKREDVQIKLYTIIYELLEQVEEAMEGLLEPESKEVVIGRAEIRQVFQLSKGPFVAGCYVNSGRIQRTGRARLLRRKAVQYEGKIISLKHFQDDVKEVKAGAECGLRLDNFHDFQPGDIIECYTVEKVAATL